MNNKKKLSKKLKKFAHFVEKNAKICNVKMLKPFHYHYKLCSNLLTKIRKGFLTLRADKNRKPKKQKIFKKLEKL